MMHFLGGAAIMYIICTMRTEWLRACEITHKRAKHPQSFVIPYTEEDEDIK